MNNEQLKIYLSALTDHYNRQATLCKEGNMCSIERFEKAKSKLNGAVTAAKLLGVDIKITYTEPTHYYSTLTLVSVQ